MPIRLQHVTIPRPPRSRQDTRSFYGDLLGLVEVPVPKSIRHFDLIWYQIGENELHLVVDKHFDQATGRHYCLEFEDRSELIAIKEKLLEAGYSPWDPDPIPGRPRFFCRDPFGNTIEFTTIEGDYLELET